MRFFYVSRSQVAMLLFSQTVGEFGAALSSACASKQERKMRRLEPRSHAPLVKDSILTYCSCRVLLIISFTVVQSTTNTSAGWCCEPNSQTYRCGRTLPSSYPMWIRSRRRKRHRCREREPLSDASVSASTSPQKIRIRD